MLSKRALLKIHITLLLVATTTLAAPIKIPTNIIEQIDPGRAAEQIINPTTTPGILQPFSIKLPKTNGNILPNQAKEIRFTLGGILFTGNTIFSSKELQELYISKIGSELNLADLQTIAQEISAHYRNAGYILTQVIIPPQEINKNGIVKIHVIEGYVDKVNIEGIISSQLRKMLDKYGAHIANSKPLKLATLERFSLLANDLPGANVRAVLTSSTTTQGAADLTFITTEKTKGWYVGGNNYNSEFLGREQFIGSVYYNEFLPGSQTSLKGVISRKIERFNFIAVQHKQQLNSNGLGFDANISNTKTKPNFSSIGLAAVNTPGEAFLFVANTNYPLIKSRQKNLIFGAGVSLLNSHTNFATTRLFDDAIRSVNVKVSYDFVSKFDNSSYVTMILSRGLNVLGAKASPPSIPGGNLEFTKVMLNLVHYQKLYTNIFHALLEIRSQYSFNQLLSSEKFGFGGGPFGYGYDPSVITGDQGIGARAELQYYYPINTSWIPVLQWLIFGDTATVWNINKTILIAQQHATSAGGGVRATAFKSLAFELLLAKPFNKFITNDNKTNLRFLFNIFYAPN